MKLAILVLHARTKIGNSIRNKKRKTRQVVGAKRQQQLGLYSIDYDEVARAPIFAAGKYGISYDIQDIAILEGVIYTCIMVSLHFLIFTLFPTAVFISAFQQSPRVKVIWCNNKECQKESNNGRRRHVSLLAKGFGDGTKTKTKSSTVDSSHLNKDNIKLGPWKITEPRNDAFEKSLVSMELSHLKSKSIVSYLNPLLLADPLLLKTAADQVRAGNVVVLKDALDPILAEATHRELRAVSAPWEHNEPYFNDGYHFKHSNIFKRLTLNHRP